jgi:hypothetical protein
MEEDGATPWQASVQTTDRLVIQIGRGVGERDGCVIVDLTDEAYADLSTALDQPNGGVLMAEDGALTVLDPPPPPEPTPTVADLLVAVAEQLETATTPKQQAAAVLGLAQALRGVSG